jgi:hypothetical protein
MPGRDVVHLLRETKSGNVITKCGVTGRNDRVRTTAWHTDVTCPECQS